MLIFVLKKQVPPSRTDGCKKMAEAIPGDADWARPIKRWTFSWRGSAKKDDRIPMTISPNIDDMMGRILLDQKPPQVTISHDQAMRTPVPINLPKWEGPPVAKLQYPYEPSSRLGYALLKKQAVDFKDIHFVNGTSFIYALAGDSSYTKDSFYVDFEGDCICVLHLPKVKTHALDSAGHRCEHLFAPNRMNLHTSFHAANILQIGDFRVCVASEIDCCDDPARAEDTLVEMKSSSRGLGAMISGAKVAIQVGINGSKRVLCCHVDKSTSKIIGMESHTTEDIQKRSNYGWTYSGQRVKYLLQHIRRICLEKRAIVIIKKTIQFQ